MKEIFFIILAGLLLISFTVQAEDVSKLEYQNEIQDLLNQYGDDFDDCFAKLPADFPSLPDDFKELDEIINELQLNKWYHRKIPYFNTEIDEIFFTFKTDMSHFAIRVAYLYNEEESEYIIYAVHFYETIEGLNSELWHMETLPHGVIEKSIQEIDVCKGTPGFEFLFVIISILTIALIILIRKR